MKNGGEEGRGAPFLDHEVQEAGAEHLILAKSCDILL